jgi:hypothetical protein
MAEGCVKGNSSLDVGESPALDRLVVIADGEDAVRRGREEQGESQQRAIDILDLVD